MPSKEARVRDPAVERAERERSRAQSDVVPVHPAVQRAASGDAARAAGATETVDLAIASLDEAGRIKGFDAGFGALFDRLPAVGEPADALFGDEGKDRVAAAVRRAASEGRASVALALAGGSVRARDVTLTAFALAGGGERATELALVIDPRAPTARDRRGVLELTAAMDAANRNAAFDLAQAMLCHDLGNAVTSALLALQALAGLNRHGALGTEGAASELITRGLDATHHAAELVTRARESERRRHGSTPGTARVSDSVESVLLMTRGCAETDNVRVTADVDPVLCVALGADELTQVMLNLVVHAIASARDAAHEAGREGNVRIWAHGDGAAARVLVHVKDDGAGMDDASARRLFDVVTAVPADRSTRIALAVARRVVDVAGGRIQVRSEPGEGTEVVVELPVETTTREG